MNTRYDSTAPSSNKLLLVLFWVYVLVPLAWGVVNTVTQAIKLFG